MFKRLDENVSNVLYCMKVSLELMKSQSTVQLNLLGMLCQCMVLCRDNIANVQEIDELSSFLQKLKAGFRKCHESLNLKWSRDKKEITLECNFNTLRCSQRIRKIEDNWKLLRNTAGIQNDPLSACL